VKTIGQQRSKRTVAMVQLGETVVLICVAAGALAHTTTTCAFTPDAVSTAIGKHPPQVATDRRSATMEDLDRKTELERRIEDGMFYEHHEQWPSNSASILQDDIPIAQAVWVGYRFTEEERLRMKSANVY
jgi:hypothetical protein